jgi:ribosome-associated protein
VNIDLLRQSLRASVELAFSRSSGPGGQNVNKVNTKVEARIRLADLSGLSAAELFRVKNVLSGRIVEDEVLRVVASEERTQAANRETALRRLEAIIASAAKIPKKRLATKPTKMSIENRLSSKIRRGRIKKMRNRKPAQDE